MVDHRGERRRLARSRGADEQHEAARLHDQLLEQDRQAQLLDRRDVALDGADHHADFAALFEHVDAEAARVLDRDRQIELEIALELRHLTFVHERIRDLLDHAARQTRVAERVELAFHFDVHRRARREKHVRRAFFGHQFEKIADVHDCLCCSIAPSRTATLFFFPEFRRCDGGRAIALRGRLSHNSVAFFPPLLRRDVYDTKSAKNPSSARHSAARNRRLRTHQTASAGHRRCGARARRGPQRRSSNLRATRTAQRRGTAEPGTRDGRQARLRRSAAVRRRGAREQRARCRQGAARQGARESRSPHARERATAPGPREQPGHRHGDEPTMTRAAHWVALGLLAAGAVTAAPAAKHDRDYERLRASLNELEADPVLGNLAPAERALAEQAVQALANDSGGKQMRAYRLYMAERRVDIAYAAAQAADQEHRLEALDHEHDRMLVEASRRDAEQARLEAEKQRIQSLAQAEEAERLRAEAEA